MKELKKKKERKKLTITKRHENQKMRKKKQ